MENENFLLFERIKELEAENLILKQQHIEVNEAKELYLKIFEEFPALIWRSRLDKLCDYFNKTWLDFTGRTMEQEFGNGWAEGVHPDDLDTCFNTYVAAFDKRQSFLMEYRMKNRYGDYCWIRDFGRPFYDLDNTFLGYIGSCYDITENKLNELKLIELNSTKDKFFSIIAHDLKSPFNSIIGFCELLIDKIPQNNLQEIGDFAEIIKQSSERAMTLLTNLLDWAQSQTGRMEFNPESIEIGNLTSEISVLLNNVGAQKGITIENQIPSGIFVFADLAMISTVLRNLVSNAIKFTHSGGKVILSASNKQNQMVVSVIDNGVGIEKEKISHLFNLNKNNSTHGTLDEKGTGLGLILCKEFIEKNDGQIWVESEIGIGSTFSFSIPLN